MPFIGNIPTAIPLTGADIEDGTVQIADLAATGTKDATTFLRGDGTFASAGGDMTPAFQAILSSTQTLSDNVETKIQFSNEVFDTNSCYDPTTNYRFTPNIAGKYYIFSRIWLDSNASNNFLSGSVSIFKNGSRLGRSYFQVEGDGRQFSLDIDYIDTANGSSDYYEIYGHCDTSSGASPSVAYDASDIRNVFGAYKIIE